MWSTTCSSIINNTIASIHGNDEMVLVLLYKYSSRTSTTTVGLGKVVQKVPTYEFDGFRLSENVIVLVLWKPQCPTDAYGAYIKNSGFLVYILSWLMKPSFFIMKWLFLKTFSRDVYNAY